MKKPIKSQFKLSRNYVWELKRDFERDSGKQVYWTYSLGGFKGRTCLVVTLGVDGEVVQTKVKNHWKNNRGFGQVKARFLRRFGHLISSVKK